MLCSNALPQIVYGETSTVTVAFFQCVLGLRFEETAYFGRHFVRFEDETVCEPRRYHHIGGD